MKIRKNTLILLGIIIIGIGFLIYITQLKQPKEQRFPYFGIRYFRIDKSLKEKLNLPVDSGMLVTDVIPGGPADMAGICKNDIVLEIGSTKIDEDSPEKIIKNYKIGDEVTLKVLHEGEEKEIVITRSFPSLKIYVQHIDKEFAKKNNLPVNYGAWVKGNEKYPEAVIPGGPADIAGIKENDIILEVDGIRITKENPLPKIIRTHYKIGDEVTLKVLHEGEEKEVKAKLEGNLLPVRTSP